MTRLANQKGQLIAVGGIQARTAVRYDTSDTAYMLATVGRNHMVVVRGNIGVSDRQIQIVGWLVGWLVSSQTVLLALPLFDENIQDKHAMRVYICMCLKQLTEDPDCDTTCSAMYFHF
jgi:beta-lactamase class D